MNYKGIVFINIGLLLLTSGFKLAYYETDLDLIIGGFNICVGTLILSAGINITGGDKE